MEWFKNEEEWDSYAVATKTLMLNCNKRMYISGTLVIPYPGRGREAQIIALAVGSAIETCQDVAEKMPRSRARTKDGEPKHRKGFQPNCANNR